MKKISLSVIFVSLVLVLAGCSEERFMVEKPGPDVFEEMTPSASTEVALAEEVIAKRIAYRKELEKIKSFYEQTGNQLKLEWVDRELASIDKAPRYRYIIEAEVAGDLNPSESIPKATALYNDALKRYKTAHILPLPGSQFFTGELLLSKKRMRLSLNKVNQLIQEYPTSDKVDDAAYLGGEIHEFFEDWSIAVLYYKRAFQWDADTPHPARYKAAKLLDEKLFERDKALELYKAALDKEAEYLNEDIEKSIRRRMDAIAPEPDSKIE